MTSKKETNNNYYFIKGIGGYALAVVVVVIIIITLIYERSVGLFVCPVLRGEKNSVASDPIALDLIGGNDLPVVPPTTTTTTTKTTTKTTKTTISHSQPIITNLIESSTKLPEDTYSDKYITKAPPRNATLLLIILLRLHFNNSLPYVSKTDPKGINFMKTTIILRNTFQIFLHKSDLLVYNTSQCV
uniref:Uncharacterized LOC101242041 n=1 Tax=Ciona intestinalis TaxID=7719 RepID=H2XPM4_CIOIN|nr:uncharacterized protein LOC101242041 [Ciona intestinalis]|eukprot:XP_004225526.1 uncharacterized protein LOC101242041 [Ciona intestinalis]